MPELPEVETTRRGIAPHLCGRRIAHVIVREPRLRWPVTSELVAALQGATVTEVSRRAKYLLLKTARGTALVHLGMSGSLRMLSAATPAGKHDHVDLVIENGSCLRLTDPRRFGALLWCAGESADHPLLRDLGPEPLEAGFDGAHLFKTSRGRRIPVKSLIMDPKIVVGVGNIYASESLFLAGIHPHRAAGRIGRERYERLADGIRQVLCEAIAAGGTTLRDFVGSDGRPGYFVRQLRVYGRSGEPCLDCGTVLRHQRTGQRSTYFCPHCQR